MLLAEDVPWTAYPLLVVDFETDGPDPLTCEPVSFAAVRYELDEHGAFYEEKGAFYSLVNPGRPIAPESTEIHGITDEHVRDAPPFELLCCTPELIKLAEGALPVAYNTAFDRTVFHRHVSGPELPLFNGTQRWLCALVMIRKIDRYARGTGRHKLTNVAVRYGVPMSEGEAHNALNDVRCTARVLFSLMRIGKVNGRVKLGRMLDYIDACRAEQDQNYRDYQAKLERERAQQELPLGDALTSERVDASPSQHGDKQGELY